MMGGLWWFSVVLTACCAAVLLLQQNRAKGDDAYEGVVVGHEERDIPQQRGIRHAYLLRIRRADGSETKVDVGRRLWEQFADGDRIVKRAGSPWPEKP
jgi:hypothetical protein